MSTYKLTYFNGRGRGEIARLIFAASGVKYEDIRVEFTQWPQIKPATPFGQIPMLEVDGVKLCQSLTIARFLANRFGLAGKTDIEKARADMIVDCLLSDVKAPSAQFVFEKDKAKQAELREKYAKESLPAYIEKVDKLLKENKGGDSYFVGDSITWADLAFVDLCHWLTAAGVTPDFSSTPKLKALKEKVEAHPKIAEWIKNRPTSDL